MTTTTAYLNWGRWVSDCPTPGCGNALGFFFQTEEGERGRPAPTGGPSQLPAEFHCIGQYGCGRVSQILWPDEFDSVNAEHGLGWHEQDRYDDNGEVVGSVFEFKGDTDSAAQSWRPA